MKFLNKFLVYYYFFCIYKSVLFWYIVDELEGTKTTIHLLGKYRLKVKKGISKHNLTKLNLTYIRARFFAFFLEIILA